MSNKHKKNLFYLFVVANVALLIYAYVREDFLSPAMIKEFLVGRHFLTSFIIYTIILVLRGLTLIPGTAFIITGVYLFSPWQVFLAIQLAIFCYCFIIYNFAHKLHFKIPQKILEYEKKVKTKEIPIIFSLCFIPGISINVLIYFLSIINVSLRNILIGVLCGTCITSTFYIYLWHGVIISANYFIN